MATQPGDLTGNKMAIRRAFAPYLGGIDLENTRPDCTLSPSSTKTLIEQTVLQHQIDAGDHEIERLVYDLYGLIEDEIKIIEAVEIRNTTAPSILFLLFFAHGSKITARDG